MTGKLNIAVWFSCGAASAVAAKKTVEIFGAKHNIRILNTPIKEEDPDNQRFLLDVQEWIGLPIEQVVNPLWNSSAVEVWEKEKAMVFPFGAPCTRALKKHARFKWEKKNDCDAMVFGFTKEEQKRHDALSKVEILPILPVLINKQISKQDCFDIIHAAGIKLPDIYLRGYPNGNCIGCVKVTSPTYWNHVRIQDPDVFQARAEQSRRLGVRLVIVKGKRIFLDELDPKTKGRALKSLILPECGVLCDAHN